MRPDKRHVIQSVALQFAELSTCSQRAKVGAVLYDDHYRIVATGYNGAPQGVPHCDDVGCILDDTGSCVMAVHAEINAILQCAVYGISTNGLNLYCTFSPCNRCAVIILRAGIKCVGYSIPYLKGDLTTKLFRGAGVEYKHWSNDDANFRIRV